MKKYSIKYQDGNDLKELILETSNISNEILPQNIISIKESHLQIIKNNP
mgnify:CR=1 FL=1